MGCTEQNSNIICKNYQDYKEYKHTNSFYTELRFLEEGQCKLFHYFHQKWERVVYRCYEASVDVNYNLNDTSFKTQFYILLFLLLSVLMVNITVVLYRKRESVKQLYARILPLSRIRNERKPDIEMCEWNLQASIKNLERVVKEAEMSLLDTSTIMGEQNPFILDADRAFKLVEEMRIKDEKRLLETRERLESLRSSSVS